MYRVRIRFRKQDDLRLTSHRDLVRVLERLFRRAEIAVCPTEGFHPKPRMNFAAPLTLGIAGLDEVMEVDLADAVESDQLLSKLSAHTVPGLTFTSVEPLPEYHKKAQARLLSYSAAVPAEREPAVAARVGEFLAAETYQVDRDGRPLEIRPLVAELQCIDGLLLMQLHVVHEAGVRPRDMLEVLGFTPDEIATLELERTAVELHA